MRAPQALLRSALPHTGRRLNGFILAIAVLAITSRLCTRVAAQLQNMNSTLQLALYPYVRVVARCGARRLANAQMPSEGGKLSTRSNGT